MIVEHAESSLRLTGDSGLGVVKFALSRVGHVGEPGLDVGEPVFMPTFAYTFAMSVEGLRDE